jgi:hypothetical protein
VWPVSSAFTRASSSASRFGRPTIDFQTGICSRSLTMSETDTGNIADVLNRFVISNATTVVQAELAITSFQVEPLLDGWRGLAVKIDGQFTYHRLAPDVAAHLGRLLMPTPVDAEAGEG